MVDPVDAALPDVDWAAVGPGLRRCSLRVPSGRLTGLASGDAGSPRVVLAPGITGSKEDFRFMLPFPVLVWGVDEIARAVRRRGSSLSGP